MRLPQRAAALRGGPIRIAPGLLESRLGGARARPARVRERDPELPAPDRPARPGPAQRPAQQGRAGRPAGRDRHGKVGQRAPAAPPAAGRAAVVDTSERPRSGRPPTKRHAIHATRTTRRGAAPRGTARRPASTGSSTPANTPIRGSTAPNTSRGPAGWQTPPRPVRRWMSRRSSNRRPRPAPSLNPTAMKAPFLAAPRHLGPGRTPTPAERAPGLSVVRVSTRDRRPAQSPWLDRSGLATVGNPHRARDDRARPGPSTRERSAAMPVPASGAHCRGTSSAALPTIPFAGSASRSSPGHRSASPRQPRSAT